VPLILAIFSFLFSFQLFAEDISLTVEEYDHDRLRASIIVVDSSQIPLGTIIRVHSKTGTCEVTLTERVNDHLIGITKGCAAGVIQPGMKLAYSSPNNWENRSPASEVTTTYDSPSSMGDILSRMSVFVGHNFARQLEGNVRSDGSIKNLDGDTAISLGLKARAYDFTDRISLGVELGYESPRTLDQATYNTNGVETVGGTIGYSPRLSLWSLAVLGQAQVLDRVNAFAGLNLSLPNVSNSQFSMSGDIGFQGGANFLVYPQVAIEGLIKITNMNMKNNLGETTDVSLAGLELRGRYNF
jgi:hypothetical protein